jgi:hypothetical protein
MHGFPLSAAAYKDLTPEGSGTAHRSHEKVCVGMDLLGMLRKLGDRLGIIELAADPQHPSAPVKIQTRTITTLDEVAFDSSQKREASAEQTGRSARVRSRTFSKPREFRTPSKWLDRSIGCANF